MAAADDSHIARVLVERKLCTAEELELIRSERKTSLDQGNDSPTLRELLIRRGYVTNSQWDRVHKTLDEDSMYKPAQQIPGYQILGKIGQGAMAVVFKAKQLSLDRIVAIKVLPKRLSENQEFVERFYREGRAAAQLNHAHIVGAYDVGEAGGYHYFVMEFIDGKTVHQLLQEQGRLPEEVALRYVQQCAEALAHAHSCGFIHRDVKPKNIMITQNADNVKLADMGLAREVNDFETATAEAGRAYGTPYYISPEQIRGEINIDGRADIYALGATFYHMVTGKVPFDGATPSVVMHKHLKEPLNPPDHVITDLTSGIGEIIEVMMAKKPEERYPSTAELIDDLRAVSRGEPPLHARDTYDQGLLETLATSGQVIKTDELAERLAENASQSAGSWPIVAGISLVLNVVLLLAVVLMALS
jgi:serine/threonine protein kinase